MAQLSYNSINKFRYYGQEFENEVEKPVEETFRDRLLKQIISNQLKTDLKIEDCLKNKVKFEKGANQKDVSEFTKGLLRSDTYKKICSEFNLKEILSSCDLDDGDVKILLNEDCKRGQESDEAYLQKLKNIQEKIENRQSHLDNSSEDCFSGAIPLSRHEYEDECNRVCLATAEKLTPCLVQLKPFSDPNLPPDHPINSLQDLEKILFPQTTTAEAPQQERKMRKRPLETDTEGSSPLKYFSENPKSFWDMKQRPIVAPQSTNHSKAIHGCDPKPPKAIPGKLVITPKEKDDRPDYSKPFVWTLEPSKLIPLDIIYKNKASIQDIILDSKFKNYETGTPSRTLYIKNLPRNLVPLPLVSLFSHFEEENVAKIEYRILKGRMLGQAFIKFSNTQISEQALNLCNGYIMEGKPIVIEYSKKL